MTAELLAAPGPTAFAPPPGVPAADVAAARSLVCVQVQRVTADMKTFVFVPEGQPFRYEPGQHLAFTFRVEGREVERRYTLSSAPTRPHTVTITVKRVPGGLVSNWLHDHLAPGDVVRARGPLGCFSTARHPAPRYLFLSGGSGVTPLMSMTRTLYDLAAPADVVFLHSARTPEDIPFRQELELIAASAPAVRVTHVCEADGAGSPWSGPRGRLSLDLLRQVAPDFAEREVFACGPPGYLRAVSALLAEAGFPADRHHQETFGTSPPAPPEAGDPAAPPDAAVPAAPPDAAVPIAPPNAAASSAPPDAAVPVASPEAGTFTVRLARSGTSVPCAPGTPVLEAAARAGITLPSSCGQGMCGSCMTTLEHGTVDMRHSGGIRPRDIARDKILLCCSTPLEDLVIDA